MEPRRLTAACHNSLMNAAWLLVGDADGRPIAFADAWRRPLGYRFGCFAFALGIVCDGSLDPMIVASRAGDRIARHVPRDRGSARHPPRSAGTPPSAEEHILAHGAATETGAGARGGALTRRRA